MTWWVQPAATINGKLVEPPGFDADHFLIDWEHQEATCPEGHTSSSWTPAKDLRTNEVIKIKFSTTDCQSCPSRSLCTHAIRYTRRTVTIRPQEQYEALKQRREQEDTKAFTQLKASRAGIEGTISKARAHYGYASLPLHWAGENPLATRRHGCRFQSGSQYGMVQWPSSRSDSAFCFCSHLRRHLEGFASGIKFADSGKKHFRWKHADVLRKLNGFFDLL